MKAYAFYAESTETLRPAPARGEANVNPKAKLSG